MSALLIWLNQQEAKLFHLKPQSIHVENFGFQGRPHPVEKMGVNHPIHQTDEEAFYRQLAKKLEKNESKNWLLMGPSLGPKHFHRHLQAHHPSLCRKVIGIEKVDSMPDSEILSVGRKYLQHFYMFQGAN